MSGDCSAQSHTLDVLGARPSYTATLGEGVVFFFLCVYEVLCFAHGARDGPICVQWACLD